MCSRASGWRMGIALRAFNQADSFLFQQLFSLQFWSELHVSAQDTIDVDVIYRVVCITADWDENRVMKYVMIMHSYFDNYRNWDIDKFDSFDKS